MVLRHNCQPVRFCDRELIGVIEIQSELLDSAHHRRIADAVQMQQLEIRQGRDFVQLNNGPFDLDLLFGPDGIERFEDAWSRREEVEGFMVCSIDDIIASKKSANRAKDRESLPRLEAFRTYLQTRGRNRTEKDV